MRSRVQLWRSRSSRVRGSPEVLMALALVAVLALAEAFMGDGFNELTKHDFIFNVAFDCCLIVDASVLGRHIFTRLRSSFARRPELNPGGLPAGSGA